ncbi:MAG: GAF domain-containing protein [Natronomonas sp.]
MPHMVAGDGTRGIEHVFDVGEHIYDPTVDFETKLTRLFEIETEAFNLPYGFLTRIDPAAGEQTIEAAHGSHDSPQEGETVSLSKSYCRKTIGKPDGVFHIDNAPEEGLTADPAYQHFGLDTYLGAAIGDGKNFYGTLCFGSSDPRETQITAAERRLIKLLAMWVRNVFKIQFQCECGQSLFLPTESNSETASVVSCEECESKYAVTISEIGDLHS